MTEIAPYTGILNAILFFVFVIAIAPRADRLLARCQAWCDALVPIDWWSVQIAHWDEEGTLQRIQAAQDNETPVKAKSESGEAFTGVISYITPPRGLHFVGVGNDELFVTIYTGEFLELNPELGRSWIELNPDHVRKCRRNG